YGVISTSICRFLAKTSYTQVTDVRFHRKIWFSKMAFPFSVCSPEATVLEPGAAGSQFLTRISNPTIWACVGWYISMPGSAAMAVRRCRATLLTSENSVILGFPVVLSEGVVWPWEGRQRLNCLPFRTK